MNTCNTSVPRDTKVSRRVVKVNKVTTKGRLKVQLEASYIHVLLDILECLNCPKSVAIAIALRNFEAVSTSDLKNLLECNYRMYNSIWGYKCAVQSVALLKKTNMFPKRYDASDLKHFYMSSETIARNQRELLSSHGVSFESRTILNRAKSILHTMLGEVPSSIANGRFGPGSTYLRRGKDSHIIAKLQNTPECTPLAHDYVYRLLSERPQYVRSYTRSEFTLPLAPLAIVPGDRLSLVDKDIFKPRVMCPQPTGNMYYQLGLMDVICKRFYRFTGYDLLQATDTHRALVTYSHEEYGTIDLSDASDSISLKLLEELLSPSWYELIRSVTCRQTKVKSDWYPNAKAFAQGCGITFPMETAIFYAIAYAVVESKVTSYNKGCIRDLISVFGDDIIVPIHYQKDVCAALCDVGFSVNSLKSFGLLDNFKESCGTDTISGINVRPIYFKEFEANQTGINLLANLICDISYFLTGEDAITGERGIYLAIFNRARKRTIAILERCDIEPIYIPASFDRTEGIWHSEGYLITFRGGTRAIRICQVKSRQFDIGGDPFTTLAAALAGVSSRGYNIRGATTIKRKWRLVYESYTPLRQY